MQSSIDWPKTLAPMFALYSKRKHPLDYQSRYQLLIMVILSAQASDVQINKLAPGFFEKYPDLASLAKVAPQDLFPLISRVRNFANKAKWMTSIARELGDDSRIPNTMAELTNLSGIGRKSASVIIRESGGVAEGIVVDLHVVRVAPRLGLTSATDPGKIEKDLMRILPKESWNDAGMGFSFLGRDICRPTKPLCGECPLSSVCVFFAAQKSRAKSADAKHAAQKGASGISAAPTAKKSAPKAKRAGKKQPETEKRSASATKPAGRRKKGH